MNFFIRCINKLEHEFIKFRVKKSNLEYGIKRNKEKIIVSLTTFKERLDYIEPCLKSIILQDTKPDKIIVWIGSDTDEAEVEYKLGKFKKYGIEFMYDTEEDYKSHKKYIYAIDKYKDAIIITMDDDLIYAKNTITTLLKMHKKFPYAIVARRVHKIMFKNGVILPYKEWKGEYKKEKKPSHFLIATTGAGTLFPPNSLAKEVTNFELIRELALTADDIWLKFMALRKNTKVVWAGNKIQMPATIKLSQNKSLAQENVIENKNDKYIKKIMETFNITEDDFYKE